MGGVTVLLTGDFRQTLPVIPRGSRADEIKACIKASYLWPLIELLSLNKNMRVHLGGDVTAGKFSELLLKIGDGDFPELAGKLVIIKDLGLVVTTLQELTVQIYPDIADIKNKSMDWLCESPTLTPKNDRAAVINEILLKSFKETEMECCAQGKLTFIPCIPLLSSNYPFEFQRLQFTIKVSFAMTINKSQGQSLKIAGIDLSDDCFTHGEIYKAWVKNGNEERKLTKFRKCEGSVIDKEFLVWFSKTREKNLPVSGPTIQEKAKQLAEVHGLNDFKASNGWLEKFRKRHNISFKSICGEASAIDRIAVEDWKKKLPNVIDKYEKRDIFNADETGLFFRVLPNKTMTFKNETCSGGKVSKDRLTVLLCCNIIGEFERPLVIGKAKRPRAFKKLDVNKFPVDWCWNKKAWMTTQIMTDWLMKFDKQMIKSQKKVLLFVDNAASHPHLKLQNVELVFFPPNMTSHCQPLDPGIIQQFKKLYRKQLLQKAVADLDAGESSAINVLDAVYWVASAQAQIKPETVKKCFLRCGFSHQVDEQLGQTIDTGEQSVIDGELLALITLINSSVEVETYFELDKIISIHDTNLTGTDDPDEPDESENEEEDEPEEAETSKYQITNLQDALSAVKSVNHFISSIDVKSNSIFTSAVTLANDITNEIVQRRCNYKQKKLTDFFKQK
ncbi:hypothetical protein QTP88_004380 [Uroleucon formosanum]